MPIRLDIAEMTLADLDEWVAMALLLWPEEEMSAGQAKKEMRAEMEGILRSPRDTAFIARDGRRDETFSEKGKAIAFINLSICNEYVPGATHFPVGYVEGIYVADHMRQRGIGSVLIRKAEEWAQANGCTQLASDVLIENKKSCLFHTQVGFQEVERVVCFIKDMEMT